MKNILLFLAISSTLFFTSCEGDQGPPGEPGINILGQVFETTVNYQFNAGENTYSSPIISFPSNVVVYESDVVLVYRYVDQTGIGGGETADVWTQLPQNIFYNDGTGDFFQYNFNHTFVDIQFTIEGNFDLINMDPVYLNNQTFRVAIVPSEFAKTNPSMKDILEVMQVNDSQIEKIEL